MKVQGDARQGFRKQDRKQDKYMAQCSGSDFNVLWVISTLGFSATIRLSKCSSFAMGLGFMLENRGYQGCITKQIITQSLLALVAIFPLPSS